MQLVKLKILNMKTDPRFDERRLQKLIADDSAILGIGDVSPIERERIQDSGGRLDILLEDQNDNSRYEVEIQLGATDETHIIRTIEYWDNERKKYPQYNHTAVIVAEEITGRFFNVIGLFNGFIPIMAIKVTAVELPSGDVSILFTKILDTVILGYEDEPEKSTDRSFWETIKSSKEKVTLADKILEIVKSFAGSAELNYTKHYIGFRVNDKSCNFAICRASAKVFRLCVALPKTDEWDQLAENASFVPAEYHRRDGYRRVFSADEIKENEEPLRELLRQAYEHKS